MRCPGPGLTVVCKYHVPCDWAGGGDARPTRLDSIDQITLVIKTGACPDYSQQWAQARRLPFNDERVVVNIPVELVSPVRINLDMPCNASSIAPDRWLYKEQIIFRNTKNTDFNVLFMTRREERRYFDLEHSHSAASFDDFSTTTPQICLLSFNLKFRVTYQLFPLTEQRWQLIDSYKVRHSHKLRRISRNID